MGKDRKNVVINTCFLGLEREVTKMVYVTWNDTEDDEPNVISFSTREEAEEFCKENGLKTEECCDVMDW